MTFTNENFYESFCAVKRMLDARNVSLDERHYILVPDKCSLYAERFLFAESGAFDAEVLSFGRLYAKFRDPRVGFLPRAGAVMLLSAIIREQKQHFRVFGMSAEFFGLAEKMYEAISAAGGAGLSPSDFCGISGAAGLKLADIQRVYAEYNKQTAGRYVDADGRTQLLATVLESADLSGVTFYIAGFDRWTKAEESVLNVIKKRAKDFVLFNVAPPVYRFGEVEFYEAAAVSDRIKAMARRIRQEVVTGAESGVRYRDFCVLAPPALSLPLSRIFTEFEIPFYIDKKQALSESALFRFLELCEAAHDSYCRQLMIALSKNHYAGIDKRDADAFEDYVTARAVNYNGFKEPFCGEEFAACESVRVTLLATLNRFRTAYQRADSPDRFVPFLYGVLADCNAAEQTERLSAACGTDQSQIYEKLVETAELLLVSAPSDAGNKELFRLFCEGVQATQISPIASVLDAVVVGGAETFRGGRFRGVFVPEFCEGLVPEVRDCAGLIGKTESKELQAKGCSVPLSTEELNRYAHNETVRLFHLADKLFLAYSDEGGSRLSSLALQVMAGATRHSRTTSEEEKQALYISGVTPEAVSCKSNALELLICSRGASAAGKAGFVGTSELKAVCDGREEPYLKRVGQSGIPTVLQYAGTLFCQKKRISVSRIQTYFSCPYRCFAQYGLRLQERDDGDFSAPDAGRFLHSAAELFVRSGGFSEPEDSMNKVVQQLTQTVSEYTELARRAPIRFARVCDEAVRLARPIALSYTAGAFFSRALEARFGFNDGKDTFEKTLSWTIGGRVFSLCGIIDRVDECGELARVIDYKSGTGRNTKFSLSNLYYGTSLQLPLYLKVLTENGKRPAGMFYFPLNVRFSDGDDAHKLSGVFCNDEEAVDAFDAALGEPGYKSSVINAKRNTSVNRKTKCVELAKSDSHTDAAGIISLLDYAYAVAEKALEEISGGFIKPSPLKDVCVYCKYGVLCGFDPKANAVRKTELTKLGDILSAGGVRK